MPASSTASCFLRYAGSSAGLVCAPSGPPTAKRIGSSITCQRAAVRLLRANKEPESSRRSLTRQCPPLVGERAPVCSVVCTPRKPLSLRELEASGELCALWPLRNAPDGASPSTFLSTNLSRGNSPTRRLRASGQPRGCNEFRLARLSQSPPAWLHSGNLKQQHRAQPFRSPSALISDRTLSRGTSSFRGRA